MALPGLAERLPEAVHLRVPPHEDCLERPSPGADLGGTPTPASRFARPKGHRLRMRRRLMAEQFLIELLGLSLGLHAQLALEHPNAELVLPESGAPPPSWT
jgi:hypothetical protein